MRALSIVSNHPEIPQSVFDTDDEIWVFNKRGTDKPRYDVLFQVHMPYVWEPLHGDWLQKNTTTPVYMLEKYPDIPMAIEYPLREAIALTDNVKIGVKTPRPFHFLPFSLTLALALAILQKRPRIKLWRVELTSKAEYWIQRNSYAFWVGFAAGRGLELEIRGSEDVFKPDLYQFSIHEYIEDKLEEESQWNF